MTIIDKLRSATEGSPELDLEIMKHIGEINDTVNSLCPEHGSTVERVNVPLTVQHFEGSPTGVWEHPNGKLREVGAGFGAGRFRHIVKYTRSIDAAMTLIPEGWSLVSMTKPSSEWDVRLYNALSPVIVADHQSLPIAICLAALEARGG